MEEGKWIPNDKLDEKCTLTIYHNMFWWHNKLYKQFTTLGFAYEPSSFDNLAIHGMTLL